MSGENESLIARLVGLHGEGGLAPTATDWRRIFDVAGDGPLTVVNLLGFRAVTGEQAYHRYTRATAGAFERAGGELLYFGTVAHAFGLGDHGDWDAVIVTRYPSARALADMWLDDDFIAAHTHRHAAVTRSRVLVSAA